MTALFILIPLCVLAVSFIVWIILKLREGNETEIETEHDWDAAQFWERK